MKITIDNVEMTYDKKTRKIGWMSDWTKCWELYKKDLIDSTYYESLHGHVDFFIKKDGGKNE